MNASQALVAGSIPATCSKKFNLGKNKMVKFIKSKFEKSNLISCRRGQSIKGDHTSQIR